MPFIAYFFVLVLTAVTAAVSLDYLTAPGAPVAKHETAKADNSNAGGTAVRQVPIGKTTRETTAQASSKDSDKSLTPIYPAAPGKDLPQPQTADATDAGGAKAPETKPAPEAKTPQPAPAQAANATPAPPAATNEPAPNSQANNTQPAATTGSAVRASIPAGACAIEACASAYRSFRASDCTYQPFEGPRKQCDMTAESARQASVPPSTMRGSVGRGGDDLDEVVRTVRRLPPPPSPGEVSYDDPYERSRIVVIQRDGARPAYGPRWIYEDR